MVDRKKIYSDALAEIKHRRNMAKAENDIHFQEVDRKIPEIAEINSQLARTGMNIVAIMKSGENVDEKLQELKDRNQEAQFLIKRLLVENGYPEDYLAIKYSCDICFDTGFVKGRQCRCLENLIAKKTVNEMNKKSQISLHSFENFDINYYRGTDMADTEKKRSIMRQIYQKCRNYVEEFNPSTSESILMFGRTGLGKTHLSQSIANELLKKGYNVLYDSTINYLNQINNEHFGRCAENSDTLGELLSAELLILDDLGSEFKNSFSTATIYNIINTRINKSLPTIISTNLNHEGMLERYDERIMSRLYAIYESYEFVGMDIRLLKKKQGIK